VSFTFLFYEIHVHSTLTCHRTREKL